MADLFRDAPIGQIIRYVTGNRVLQYPEERPDFQCPHGYMVNEKTETRTQPTLSPISTPSADDRQDSVDPEKAGLEPSEPIVHVTDRPNDDPQIPSADRPALERMETSHSGFSHIGMEKTTTNPTCNPLSRTTTREALSRAHTRADLENAFATAAAATVTRTPTTNAIAPIPSHPVLPQRTAEGHILVDWYTTTDPSNPQNWSLAKKSLVSLQICLYTLAVYMGSAIYTPAIGGVMAEFHVGEETALLGLSLYVLAYGIGPLIFSPLSEIPRVGRNPAYMVTMGIFVILLVPSGVVDSFAGLMGLRFLQGFFGSPCLATGGASLQDLFSLVKLPYVLCLWAFAATAAPALGPLIAGFSVTVEGWRWAMWELLWLAGPIFVVMLLFLPETSAANILLRRAERLRKLTGDQRLMAQSEIDQANLRPRDVVFEALVRPMQMIVMDPAIGFTAGYVALCYGIYYSFFEAFPLVYIDRYGFNLGQMGLTFLSIIVGVVLSIAIYYAYLYKIVEPEIRKFGLGAPERRLLPAIPASLLMPVGLFIFGWTGSVGHVHWIVSVIGIGIFTMGVFVLMQCIFVYLPLVYPQYAASLFAGNDFARSTLAFAAVMFSRPMYIGMGVGPATSLLGGLTAACVGGILVLYLYGDKLRARSKFSAK
ncbi:MFS general substrate transporter [Hortaea werneckii]|nr:MFS general substrate transporter [Hortaea werneckii]KAI7567423.1 MFS general substrate transporter [Hortaea werneckii]KAI7621761.1 MFS general substrate transporter [Hortaea werneckii]KAI7676996.1 MFS general substrate transporter [Hortaea werneckii]KAI7715976.1 MFS general substrate transporter [Hortaea werneckii]